MRGDSRIGEQVNTVAIAGGRVETTVEVDIRVKVLGLTAYRYAMTNREVWEDGLLQSVDAATDDDGDRGFARVSRSGGGLVVEGSGYSGAAPSDAATTTYWTTAFLTRPVWISTQSGEPLRVSARNMGASVMTFPGGPRSVETWRISGDVELDLYYDDRGEWIGNAFKADGETIRLEALAPDARFSALWPGR